MRRERALGRRPFQDVGFQQNLFGRGGELRCAAQRFQGLGDGVAHAFSLVVFAADNRNAAHVRSTFILDGFYLLVAFRFERLALASEFLAERIQCISGLGF